MNQIKLDDDYNQLITFINERNYLEAENKSLELIKKNTHNTPLFFNLFGLVNQKLKKIDLAYKSFEKALALDSKFCPALFNLGMIKFETNFYDQAIFYFNKTLEVDPNNYDCNLMLAESYAKLRQFDHAIRNYEQTIKIDFKNKDAYINLANLFQSLDLNLEAQNTLEKAIKIIGEEYKLLNNLGLIYKKKNKIEEAISIFKKILITRIDDPEPYVNLSLSYFEKEDYVKSLEFIDKAINKSNYLHELFYYKSLTLEKIGKLDESLENIEKSILIREDYFNSIQKKIEIYIKLLKHADSKILIENLDLNNESIKLDTIGILIFFSNYLYSFDQSFYLRLVELHNNILKKKNEYIYEKSKKEFCISKNKSKKKIKIGFISADFNNHAICYQLKNFFILLSQNLELELYFYYNSNKKDEINLELRKYIINWTDIESLSDYEVAKKILDNKLDLLIDLSGFTSGNRLGVFPYKICKHQITWAGYLNSVGVDGIDYILADPFVLPEESNFENLYKEKIIRFDNCWSTLSLFDDLPMNNPNNIPFNESKILTFGSLNNYLKYNDRVLDVWSDILRYTENTRLLLFGNKIFLDKSFQERFYAIFKKKNINLARILLKGNLERNESLKVYNNIDICLDPFPYNGGTTNFESAYMCVPTITLVGNNFISRCGYSINKNLNNEEWNCFSEQEYINKAINFSLNPTFILEAKRKIYENIFVKKKLSSKNLVENFIRIAKTILE